MGEIHYINVDTEAMPQQGYRLPPFMYKRKSFAHEHEVRAIISTSPYLVKPDDQPFTLGRGDDAIITVL